MEEKELIENLKTKLKEAKKIINFYSKDFRFKSWHTSTGALLRSLPSRYKFDVNDFKKLTFEDTKYHRGNKFFKTGYDAKYMEDINGAIKILKKITSTEVTSPSTGKDDKTKKTAASKINVVKKEKKAKKPTIIKKAKPVKKSGQISKPKKHAAKKKIGKSTGASGSSKAPPHKTKVKPAKKSKK